MAKDQKAPEAADEATEDESPQKGGRMKSIVLIVVGLGLGTGAGMFFVGPRFFGGPTAASAESTEEDDAVAHGEQSDGHGEAPAEGGEEGGGTIHTIANLIVNPAGSNGSRFLLVDLAVGLTSEEAVTELEQRDAAARDELLLLLGSKTVQELADVSNRAGLKDEIQILVSELLTSGSAHEVFFPRFVIQ
jgi:flagellar FliL protein